MFIAFKRHPHIMAPLLRLTNVLGFWAGRTLFRPNDVNNDFKGILIVFAYLVLGLKVADG
ncbi:MAG: hypothetical protein B9J98_06305 [Candidatus Terraquivivens tikiterensis]|uniref:Uncharacterized protein n=1 Tax=Candidatus Terraquivivens tikiterensis TaxID=1980982 RepID=A0A2R7Y1P5_9ARCH|nr:MAG: hypothetical protein B9J98_06305 [Candidatus Terraquivivens tikiterensis]